jgi:hypothetical protein
MTTARRWLCALVLLLAGTAFVSFGQGDKAGTEDAASVELKGRLMPFSPEASQPARFKAESGAVYTLVSNRMSLALFTDTNLQGRTLLLKGRALAGKRFEVTGNLHSIRNGQVHELFYYCDICSIKGSDPGPCMCCREPVHIVEAPRGSEVH